MKIKANAVPPIGLALILHALLGCASPHGGQPGDRQRIDQTTVLERSTSARAEALAHYSTGLVFDRARDFDRAFEHYRSALERDPDNQQLFHFVFQRLEALERKTEALALLDHWQQTTPKAVMPLLLRARILTNNHQLKDAEAAYARIIKRFPKQPIGYLRQARFYLDHQRFSDAERVLLRGVKKAHRPYALHQILAQLYLDQADARIHGTTSWRDITVQSLHHVRAALEHMPSETPLLQKAARLCAMLDDLPGAIGYCHATERLARDSASRKRQLAELLAEAFGGPQHTIEKLQAWSRIHPRDAAAWYYLGMLYKQNHQRPEAIAAFQQAATLPPKEVTPWTQLILLHVNQAPEEAFTFLQRARQQNGDHPALKRLAVEVHFQRRHYPETLAALRALEHPNPARSVPMPPERYHYCFAYAALRTDHPKLARRHLHRLAAAAPNQIPRLAQRLAEELSPPYPTLSSHLHELRRQYPNSGPVTYATALLHYHSDRFDRALDAFSEAEKMLHASHDAETLLTTDFYLLFANAHEERDQLEAAERLYRKCLERDANHAQAINNLAYMWARRSLHLEQALNLADLGLTHHPADPHLLDTRGWTLFQLQRFDEALVALERAHQLLPHDPIILDHLGDCLAQLGHLQRARTCWERVLATRNLPQDLRAAVAPKLTPEP